MLAKLKDFVKNHQEDIILVIGVIFISLFSFSMGYIVANMGKKEPMQFEMTNDQVPMINKSPNPGDQK